MKKIIKKTKGKNTQIPDHKFGQLAQYLEENMPSQDKKEVLMAALHKTQDIFGYISREAMDFISCKLDVPTAHIYGMATFYNYFTLKPKAKYQIYTCKGTACYVSGGDRILEKLKSELGIEDGDVTKDGMFGISITRCLGCCGLSPVMQVNEDIYVRMVPEKVKGILDKYRKGHGAERRV